MIAIVMAYFSREKQLLKTLESFMQYNPNDFYVVIIDDGSPEDIILPALPFEVIIKKNPKKRWSNPGPAFNKGFCEALLSNPDIVIIQNPESYHMGDVVGYAKTVTKDQYLTFACYSQGQGEEPGSVINNKGATVDGESAWYNHPEYRPVYYHFCSAIRTANLIKLNGFDERFIHGLAFEDNYFVHQVRSLGLHMSIVTDPFVVHQWHHNHSGDADNAGIWGINERLYNDLIKVADYRAQHLVTYDLSWNQV